MTRVKIASLKNSLSRHLQHVRNGGEVLVFDRDRPIARIVPFGPSAHADGGDDYWTDARLERLEQQGVIARPAERDAAWAKTVRPVKLPARTRRATNLLLELRRKSAR